jgi:hypothetical protein
MRMPLVLAGLCLVGSTAAPAQRWSGAFAAGYAHDVDGKLGDKGAFYGAATAYRAIGPALGLGLEAAYDRFGTETALLTDPYGPGSSQREDVRRELWSLAAVTRLRSRGGAWRPYGGAGIGATIIRLRDHIDARDAAGAPLEQYRFDQTTSDVRPSLTAFAGFDRVKALGKLGIGAQVRWRGLVDVSGVANVGYVGVSLALE